MLQAIITYSIHTRTEGYSRGSELLKQGESQTVLAQQTRFVRRTETGVGLKMERLQHWGLVPFLHSFFLPSFLLLLCLSVALSHLFTNSHSRVAYFTQFSGTGSGTGSVSILHTVKSDRLGYWLSIFHFTQFSGTGRSGTGSRFLTSHNSIGPAAGVLVPDSSLHTIQWDRLEYWLSTLHFTQFND